MAISAASELPSVVDITIKIQTLLERARVVKPETTVEPSLPTSAFVDDVISLFDNAEDNTHNFSCVEKAARDTFYSIISSTGIEDPEFVDVWNLFDLLIICGDQAKCEAALICWLIEELLESQTTRDCRTVFDWLDSRRERLARNNFHKKNLALLRSCNELLRRLSRAEDAKFCGRVFFFLFQTFPLGDKSSVNLRGEFHVENTTRFEVSDPQPEQNGESMEVEPESAKEENETSKAATPQPPAKPGSKAVPIRAPPKKVEEPLLTNNELYPIFWRLQQDFSDPTRLFTGEHFEVFKKGLASTIAKFKSTPTVVQTKSGEDKDARRGTKRKFEEDGDTFVVIEGEEATSLAVNGDVKDHFVDNYNPKYLTSRDLFDLELSDQAFQRHILVQALILIDFLLSLTEKTKKLLPTGTGLNKALLYTYTLSEEDTKWANSTRTTITQYLTADQEGRLFNRMVDTVLARDKNWVRWKIESCPSIVRDPVSTADEMAARKSAREWTRIRRVPAKPSGTMDISFLDEGSGGGLAALQDPARYTTTSIDELIDGIKTDELDLDFADDEEKAVLQNAIANKRWRILRQARATRLELLDKVDPSKGLESVFKPREATPEDVQVEVADAEAEAEPDTEVTVEEVDKDPESEEVDKDPESEAQPENNGDHENNVQDEPDAQAVAPDDLSNGMVVETATEADTEVSVIVQDSVAETEEA